jgi:hypothetical protein
MSCAASRCSGSSFYLLFSFLFGYSFTLQMQSAERAGASFKPRMLRRLGGLFVLGALHGVFLVDPAAAQHAARATTEGLAGGWGSVIAEHVKALPLYGLSQISMQGPTTLAMFLFGMVAGRRKLLAGITGREPMLRTIQLVGFDVGVLGGAVYAFGGGNGNTGARAGGPDRADELPRPVGRDDGDLHRRRVRPGRPGLAAGDDADRVRDLRGPARGQPLVGPAVRLRSGRVGAARRHERRAARVPAGRLGFALVTGTA